MKGATKVVHVVIKNGLRSISSEFSVAGLLTTSVLNTYVAAFHEGIEASKATSTGNHRIGIALSAKILALAETAVPISCQHTQAPATFKHASGELAT